MKPPVKTLAFITIFFLSFSGINAQININPASSITADVKKIIDDYPNHFENVMGELVIQNPQSSDYRCNINLNGAEESVITRYSGKRNTISWRAVLLTTESFGEAKRKYNDIYNQLNNLVLRSMRLKGRYESPAEEKKFSSVILAFDPADESISKLKVEVVLEAEQMEWKVKLLIYDRDREDEERGERVE